ncbi:S-adenosyl-L-methionine-dependent methyltransferase-like [Lasallia pustulata]|uniref:S-adenosyl-L-methionine-dependent methyltransferase-like n=1 Tax=Lasallia pustulata TaxID=136370 RepID=A0A1W5CZN6_9LECA|nr:S-adenosyl-L-methionine-dependent methyltransferase-like [Lasallia pustulata]
MAITSAVLSTFDALRGYAGSVSWGPLVTFSRNQVLSLLCRIEIGQLVVTDKDGTVTICGSPTPKDGTPKTELKVHKEAFWVRLLLFADMGFAESYMLAEMSCPDLVAFFQLFILNRAQLSNATTLTSSLASTLTSLARSTNTLSNSRLNVSAHYDISNAMFAAFLSDDMTYSCPIWLPRFDPNSTHEALEDAQDTKLQCFITNARIKRTDHVLEIGTGWGSFAIAAVKATGCRITSLTLSVEQKELAEKRIAAAGYTDNIEVLLCDYRALPTPKTGLYDKVVSIEMLEAVGREYLDTYFECVHRLLKPQGGIAVFQCITMPETRYEAYSKGEDFIRKYIFPGGHLPTVSQLVGSIEKGSNATLIVDAIENIGGHYAKTLRLWKEKFQRNFESRIRPALLEEHHGMTDSDVELFRRKWEYYFTYCEAGFSTKTLGDVIITVGREGATEMLEDIPL